MPTEPSTVSREFVELLSQVAEVPQDKIEPTSAFKADLDIDSLTLVEVFTATETQWGISISEEDSAGFATVNDVVEYLSTRA